MASIIDFPAFKNWSDDHYSYVYNTKLKSTHMEDLLNEMQKTLKNQQENIVNVMKGCGQIKAYLEKNNQTQLSNTVISEALKEPSFFEQLCNWLVKTFGIEWETNIDHRKDFVTLLDAQKENFTNYQCIK